MDNDKKEDQPLTEESAAERLEAFKKAAAEGSVEIGNAAFKAAENSENEITTVAWVTPKGLGFDFSIKNFGFGQIFLTLDKSAKVPSGPDGEHMYPQGRLFIDSEHMSRDTVKAILCQAVDDGIMEWEELEHTMPEGSA